MAFPVIRPYALFTDRNGDPLDGGYIYIGEANQNPQTNPITIYWDEAATIPASQPLRTSGGYIYRNGTPANIFVSDAYSIVIRDRDETLVYSSLLEVGETQGGTQNDWGTTTGSSTVYTAGFTPALSAYIDRQFFHGLVDEANGANPTINFDGRGAKKIYMTVNGVPVQIPAGSWQAGQGLILRYDASLDSANGGFLWMNPVGSIPSNLPLAIDYTTPSKRLKLNLSGFTGATDRTAVPPNYDFTFMSQTKGADVASAATTVLNTTDGDLVDITGTTGITAITLNEGWTRTVRFTGALILTNGASLVLPGGANITTVAGDYAVFRGYAGGVVRCTSYTRSGVSPPPFLPAQFLAKKTLSGTGIQFTTEIDWTAFDYYDFVIVNAIPATNGAGFDVNLSENAGSSYIAGTSVSYMVQALDSGGTGRNRTGSGTNTFGFPEIAARGISNSAANNGLSATVRVWAPSTSVRKQMSLSGMTYFPGSTENNAGGVGSALVVSTAPVNGIRFQASSGNWTSGTISVFGYKTS